jgi:catechol-2,3-dioxygenase
MNWQCTEAFVALGSIALEQLVSFYSQLLKQQPHPYQPGVYAEYRLPSLRLAIFLPKPDHQSEFGQIQTGSMSICLQVSDLGEVIRELQAIDYPVGHIITANHGRELYTYDPDGNRLIFYEPRQDIP